MRILDREILCRWILPRNRRSPKSFASNVYIFGNRIVSKSIENVVNYVRCNSPARFHRRSIYPLTEKSQFHFLENFGSSRTDIRSILKYSTTEIFNKICPAFLHTDSYMRKYVLKKTTTTKRERKLCRVNIFVCSRQKKLQIEG